MWCYCKEITVIMNGVLYKKILDDVGYNIENDKKKEYNLYYYLLLKLYNIN